MQNRPPRALLAAFLAALLAAPAGAEAADLILNGTTTTLGGTVTYDSVQLLNGARINVATYDPANPSTTGVLHIIADSILIDATSQINGVGDGYRSTDGIGQGPGGGEGGPYSIDGGGGGAYGGNGGNGICDWW